MKYIGPRDRMMTAKLRKLSDDAIVSHVESQQALVECGPNETDRLFLIAGHVGAMSVISRTAALLQRILKETPNGQTSTVDRLSWALDIIQAEESDWPTGYFETVNVLGFNADAGTALRSPNAARTLGLLREAWRSIQQDEHWIATNEPEESTPEEEERYETLYRAFWHTRDLIEHAGSFLQHIDYEELSDTVRAQDIIIDEWATGNRFYDHKTQRSYATLDELQNALTREEKATETEPVTEDSPDK